jgi:hypothetical protein
VTGIRTISGSDQRSAAPLLEGHMYLAHSGCSLAIIGLFRRGLQAVDLLVEIALLLEVGGRLGCGSVRLKRGSRVVGHLEEVAADGVEATIGVDPGIGPKMLDEFEAGPRPGDHADGDCVVECDDRVVVEAEQDAVEGGDLAPVGRFWVLRLVERSALKVSRPGG